jgi:hypothetical protein
MNQKVFLFVILILVACFSLLFKLSESFRIKRKDGFSNYTLDNAVGGFPASQTEVLLEDTYPAIGKNQVSNESAYKMWWRYPTFELGSYAQITNNLRYPNNPDDARCTPANMCYALYKDKAIGSNYVKPLQPLNPDCGTRVGYFDTNINLLPFRNDSQNILY